MLSLPPSRPPQPAVSAGMASAAIKIKVFKCLGVWVKLNVLMLWGPVMLVSLDWTLITSPYKKSSFALVLHPAAHNHRIAPGVQTS